MSKTFERICTNSVIWRSWAMSEVLDLEPDLSLGKPGALLSLLQLLLGLPELGQVEGGDLHGLLDLLLVGLDLGLQLVGEVAHPVLVLLVLLDLEGELLGPALGLLVALGVLPSVRLHVAQLHLQLADPGLQLGHGGAASTDGVLVGIRELLLELGQLGLEGALGLGLGVGVILLSTELIGKTGSINHGLLGLLLRVLGLLEHAVDLSVHGVHGALDGPLVAGGLGVDRGHLVDGGARLGELGLGLALAPLGRVEQGASLLHLSGESIGTTVGEGGPFHNLLPLPLLLLVGALGLPVLALVALDRLLGLRVGLVGVVQSDLKLVDVALELLLDPQRLGLGALLRLEAGLHGVHGACVVLAAQGNVKIRRDKNERKNQKAKKNHRLFSNSSSFSAILRSISWRTWPSSREARRTLFSSCSTASLLLCLSSSWMERPPSPSWSSRSLISSARFLFSRFTTSSCSIVPS